MSKEKCKDTSRISILLTYMTIILAISQIFDIVYEITSKLYTSVDQLVRKFIMYVLLELPLLLISICISAISICCIFKIMNFKFKESEIIKEKNNNYNTIEDKRKELLRRLRCVIKMNIIEILTIICLPILTYMSIEGIVFQYNFKETQFVMWAIIAGLFLTFSISISLFICNSDEKTIFFSSNNIFNRAVNWLYRIITFEGMPVIKIIYMIPILINIFLIFSIKGIDAYFTNYEKELTIEKRIENDKEIKNEIIIDKLLDKVGINITDEDIEQYKKDLKEKYKMEE